MSTSSEKLKGRVKEVAGDMLNSESLEQEGKHQQEKARKTEEAAELQEEADEKAVEALQHKNAEEAADGT